MLVSSVSPGTGTPSESLLRALGLDALAERQPEAVAAFGALLHIRLRLGLLLARERLSVREADTPPSLFDREHEHLDLAVRGEGLAWVGAAAHRELSGGHEPGLPGAEAHEDAERFVALDRSGEHRAHLDARLHLLPELDALGRQGERDPALLAVDADDQHGDLCAVGRGFPQCALTAPRNLRDVQEAVDARQELDEDAELGRANRAPAHDVPLAQSSRHRGPRIALQSLQAERDPSPFLVDPEYLDGHRIADAQEIGRAAHARMRELRQGHEPLHAAQVDERAEVRQRGDGPRQHRARKDLLPRLFSRLGGSFLQQAPARNDQVAAVLAEGRDAELEHAADVLLGGLDAAQVHLRERAESTQAPDRDLVAALDHGRHLALDRNAGLRRHGQRLPRLGALAKLVREPDLVAGRHDRRLDLVADGNAELALAVGQLGALDPGFALAADVDEDVLGRDLDHAPFDDLPDLEHGLGGFSGEQGREVLGVTHAHHPRRAFSRGQDGSGRASPRRGSSMVARRAGTSSGLVRYARTPPSRNCRMRDGIASALSTITGMSRVRSSARSSRNTSSPGMSGRCRSSRISAGRWSRARSTPTRPCIADSTVV